MTSLIKKLSIALVAGIILAFGFVTPAQAANLTVSATATGGSIGTSGTNAFEIGVTYTTVTAGTDSTQVQIPTGWTAVNLANLCSVLIVNDQSMSSWSCNASIISGEVVVTITNTSGTWPSSSGISVRFPANTLNVTASRTFNVQTFTGQSLTDSGSGTLATNSVLMPTMFTVANASLVDANSNAITNLPASSAVPAFTAAASGFSAGAEYSRVGIIFSKSGNTEYFTVPNPQNIMSAPPTTSAWVPGAATCGITAISIGGVAQTGSSGISCAAETWNNNGAQGYAIRLTLAANTTSSISVSVAPNIFTSTSAGNYNFRLALSSVPAQNSNTYYSGSASVPFTVGGSSSSPSVTPVATNIALSATPGQAISGSTVAVTASGLQSSAPYSVVVQSTPQTIGSGTAVNGAVSTNVTIPAGLEPGWHTLTFSSTAADGSPVVSVTYFKVSASGTLLATTSTVPAELAITGIKTADAISFLIAGASLALVGAELLVIARRKRTN